MTTKKPSQRRRQAERARQAATGAPLSVVRRQADPAAVDPFAREMVHHFAEHGVNLQRLAEHLEPGGTCQLATSQANQFHKELRGIEEPCTPDGVRLLRAVWSAYGLDDLSGGCTQHVGMDAAGWDDGGEVQVVIHSPNPAARAEALRIWRDLNDRYPPVPVVNDVNPTCGCHIDERCNNCRCCKTCVGCFCHEADDYYEADD